jgi:hypothetical protein
LALSKKTTFGKIELSEHFFLRKLQETVSLNPKSIEFNNHFVLDEENKKLVFYIKIKFGLSKSKIVAKLTEEIEKTLFESLNEEIVVLPIVKGRF